MRLLKDNGRMYGYQITQMVKDLTKGELQITEGALYPLLHRLEEQDLVETELENIGNREAQIDRLVSYCAAQGIRYYDVQLELVDHMAEWIEHAMEEQQLSFEEAFLQMQAAFTQEELQLILKSKKKAVQAKLNKLQIKEWEAEQAFSV
ncbi:hypothetical protein F5148DRAFT_1295158 [Russula earlei]|uniref:Uncharacterized protein n=1 Tax=Russula earlei TaxID=71964 RepID=A0ACC0TR04_9AGAM|nr:hypothetical protein F5148DRAFT_1295158 [Russula earlei]